MSNWNEKIIRKIAGNLFHTEKKSNLEPERKIDINDNSYNVSTVCLSDTGHIRNHNEDNFLINGQYMQQDHQSLEMPHTLRQSTKEQIVLSVFDGMGGENAGELASYVAAKELAGYGNLFGLSESNLTELVRELNRAVYESGKEGRYGQIGTTMSMLVFHEDNVYVCNLGDSPIYLYREGQLSMLGALHTNAESLRQMGITNRKPGLTQFLGISEEEFLVEPFISCEEVKKGDLFLICSDGLTDMIDEDEISNILSQDVKIGNKANVLMQRALENGGRDNITIILSKVN